MNKNSINTSSFKAVGNSKGGGLKFDKNDLSSAVQRYRRSKISHGIKSLKYFHVSVRFTR